MAARTRGEKAFTMVEMLSAVGILLTLMILAVPLAGKVRAIRENVACCSNLRQIGLGILAFTQDNGGKLPGGLIAAQYPWYSYNPNYGNPPTQLCNYLVDYLEVKRTSTKWNGTDVFVCPAFQRAVKVLGDAPVYLLNIHTFIGDGTAEYPVFGYPCSSYPSVFGRTKDFDPLPVTGLAMIRDAQGRLAQTTTWMLKDTDQELGPLMSSDGTSVGSLPKRRVHGDHRNALFFDFHVAPVDKISLSP